MANEDKKYARWLEGRPCQKCCKAPPSLVHHRTGAGMAKRAHDHEGISMCDPCHKDFHNLSGTFKVFDKEMLRDWQAIAILLNRSEYEVEAESWDDVDFPF